MYSPKTNIFYSTCYSSDKWTNQTFSFKFSYVFYLTESLKQYMWMLRVFLLSEKKGDEIYKLAKYIINRIQFSFMFFLLRKNWIKIEIF